MNQVLARTEHMAEASFSEEAQKVREALLAHRLETPMIAHTIDSEEKYLKIKGLPDRHHENTGAGPERWQPVRDSAPHHQNVRPRNIFRPRLRAFSQDNRDRKQDESERNGQGQAG